MNGNEVIWARYMKNNGEKNYSVGTSKQAQYFSIQE